MIIHKTVSLKKDYSFSVQKVFSAFSSIEARSEWGVPEGDAIHYYESDFKIGGKDVFKCGSPKKMEFSGVVSYDDIIKNKRIISTETLRHLKKTLSVALVSIEFNKKNSGTEIVLTAQVCSLDGNDMSQGYKQGWNAVLNNLEEYLIG